MPIVIDVGISRKASRDYQSAGVSLNLRAELDQSLLTKPRELQEEIARLYREAEEAVSRQLDHTTPEPPEPPLEAPAGGNGSADHPRNGHNGNGNGHARHSHGRNGNGHANAPGNGRSAAPATESQRKAIDAIARRADVDPADEARHEFGIDFDHMTVPEASKLIDHLKSFQGTGGRR